MDRGEIFTTYTGHELKGALTARGWTIAAVAQATGHSAAAMSRWLGGQKSLPLSVLMEVCDVIGTDPREIIGRAYRRLDPTDQSVSFVTDEWDVAAHDPGTAPELEAWQHEATP